MSTIVLDRSTEDDERMLVELWNDETSHCIVLPNEWADETSFRFESGFSASEEAWFLRSPW